MEWCAYSRKNPHSTNSNGRKQNWLGRTYNNLRQRSNGGSVRQRPVEYGHQPHAVKLQGTIGNNFDSGIFQTLCKEPTCAGAQRQCVGSSISKSTMRFQPRSRNFGSVIMGKMLPMENNCVRKIPGRKSKFTSRPAEQAIAKLRMATTSSSVQVHRPDIRSPHDRQVRVNDHDTATSLQQSFLRPSISRSRCANTSGLALREQFRQLSLQTDTKNSRSNSVPQSRGHDHSALVARATVVSEATGTECGSSDQVTNDNKHVHSTQHGLSRASKKQKMENLCLENQWQYKLQQDGWSPQAITYHNLSLADSTKRQYNKVIQEYTQFVGLKPGENPPGDTHYIANFLTDIACRSERPKSQVNVTVAALSNYYTSHGMINIVSNPDITRLVTGITKGGTIKPRIPTPAMPIAPFRKLFLQWPDNEHLSLRQLRLKCVVSLALVLMLRPSDIAPRGVFFDTKENKIRQVVFALHDIQFQDTAMTIMIHGNKNDYDRDGFQVTVPASKNAKLDPIKALQCYIARTQCQRSCDTDALFLSLTKNNGKYTGLKASGIKSILNTAIKEAGLSDQGYSSKSFRVTGATTGVKLGLDPNVVRSVGRWKSCSVFEEHYVHTIPPSTFTDVVLNAD